MTVHSEEHLLPPGKCVVIIDTNAARNLGEEEDEPAWLKTFESMSEAGYSFSLAEGAFAELLAQRMRDSIDDQAFSRMLVRLKRFLNPGVPVMLGNRDIRGMIGAPTEGAPWSASEARSISVRAFEHLAMAEALKGEDPEMFERQSVDEVLQETRDTWIAQFDRMLGLFPKGQAYDEHGGPALQAFFESLDENDPLDDPAMSKRLELACKYLWRQHVRSAKSHEPYDPRSRKKRNDGIDFELFFFLALPAFIVTCDKGFSTKLDQIKSVQRGWIWTPEDLADAWLSARNPKPSWPVPP